jgi:hypothetical protein
MHVDDAKPTKFGKPIDMSDPNVVNSGLFRRLIDHFLHNSINFCFDVNLGRQNTNDLKVFLEAELGVNNAVAKIVNAANILTDGYFQQNWNSTNKIITKKMPILSGYYLGPDRVRRELSSIGLLDVAGFFYKEDAETITRWIEATVIGDRSQATGNGDRSQAVVEESLDIKYKILKEMLGEFTITGKGYRLFVDGSFIAALYKSAISAGLILGDISSNATLIGGVSRQSADWLSGTGINDFGINVQSNTYSGGPAGQIYF